jgi:hypothetical protein
MIEAVSGWIKGLEQNMILTFIINFERIKVLSNSHGNMTMLKFPYSQSNYAFIQNSSLILDLKISVQSFDHYMSDGNPCETFSHYYTTLWSRIGILKFC